MQDGVQKSYAMMLPVELHLRIRDHVLKDPNTDFHDYKTLRLVCRIFEVVWSPVVLSHIVFFPLGPSYDSILIQLRNVVHGVNNSLALAKTLTIKDWDCLNSELHGFVEEVREAKNLATANVYPPVMAKLVEAVVALVSFTAVPPVRLLKLFSKPNATSEKLKESSELLKARRYASQLPHKLDLPNVRRSRVMFRGPESKWSISRMVGILPALPQLSELEVYLPDTFDMAYVSSCLSGICTLQKLTVETYIKRGSSSRYKGDRSKIENFRTVIGSNPNLIHLVFNPALYTCDTSSLFRDVDSLKLEHLGLPCSKYSRNLLPHIQSLRSFSSYGSSIRGEGYSLFLEAGIFPPTIRLSMIDDSTVTYLERHPGLVSLGFTVVEEECLTPLFRVIAQHSKTLLSIMTSTHWLALALETIEYELNLLQCTSIQEFVLYPSCGGCQWMERVCCPPRNIDTEVQVLQVLTRLGSEMKVVIANNKSVFNMCISYCHTSEDPLVCAMERRIVYEKRTDLAYYSLR